MGFPEALVAITRWDDRFFESTKGRIVSLVRRGDRTVDELAAALGVSDNAIRPHLAALERDGVVRQRGVRPTGGKPATVYELAPDAERLFTRAYVPVLMQLVAVLEDRLGPTELEGVLREVGRRLAAGKATSPNDVRARAQVAASVLTELGGVVDVESDENGIVLRGYSCPLADAVRAHPGTCHAVESLVSELVGSGARVDERCQKGDRPRCCFGVTPRQL
jgi:predicted ArsR family transcriptional regulator